MFHLEVFVFISVFCFCVEGVCPPGWLAHATSCYHFSHDTEEWIGALNICRELGGQLIEIEDQAEDQFIIGKARAFDRDYWIALSDLQKEGTYVWMNSKTPLVSGDYTHWGKGQPDNADSNENCVNLETNFNSLWNDLVCHINQYYICEKPNEDVDIVG